MVSIHIRRVGDLIDLAGALTDLGRRSEEASAPEDAMIHVNNRNNLR